MIRPAIYDDLEELLLLFSDTHTELEWYRQFPFSVERVADVLIALIDDENGIVSVYEGEDGKVIGVIIGMIDQLWFSTAKYAVDMALVVNRKNRFERIGYKLLKHFINYVKEKGVNNIATSLNGEQDNKKYEKLLTRLGYQYHGKNYEIRI